jgi:hypothetical protein
MIALAIVSSADAVRWKNSAASFVAQAHEKTEVLVDPREPETSRPALASTRQTPASDGNEADFPWDTHQPFDAPVGKFGIDRLPWRSKLPQTPFLCTSGLSSWNGLLSAESCA